MRLRGRNKPAGIESSEVLDLLSKLVERSLVNFDEITGRYSALETIRAYSMQELQNGGELEALKKRHALQVAEFLKSKGRPRTQEEFDDTLGKVWADQENIRGALEYSMASNEYRRVLYMLGILSRFWLRSGQFSEPIERYQAVLPKFSRVRMNDEIANAWLSLGALQVFQLDVSGAEASISRAYRYYLTKKDSGTLSDCYRYMSLIKLSQGQLEKAEELFDQAQSVLAPGSDLERAAKILNNRGVLALEREDLATAQRYFEEALEIAPFEVVPVALSNIAFVAIAQGRLERGREYIEQMLKYHGHSESLYSMTFVYERISELAAEEGAWPICALMIGQSRKCRNELRIPLLTRSEVRRSEEIAERAEKAIGALHFNRGVESGRSMTLREAAEMAKSFIRQL